MKNNCRVYIVTCMNNCVHINVSVCSDMYVKFFEISTYKHSFPRGQKPQLHGFVSVVVEIWLVACSRS